jgi:hypothetical protein
MIGYINTLSVRRILIKWQEEIALTYDKGEHEELRKQFLNSDEYQVRDQELFSLVLRANSFPDVKLFPLSFEWMCPNSRHPSTLWAEGTKNSASEEFAPLTQNPCKALHAHDSTLDRDGVLRFPKLDKWLQSVKSVGPGDAPGRRPGCGGAHRLSSLPSAR